MMTMYYTHGHTTTLVGHHNVSCNTSKNFHTSLQWMKWYVITQLLLWDKLLSSLLYLGQVYTSLYKGLTHIRSLSCGFDSSVGRALHRHRRGRGFESRSEPEIFSGLCSSSVTAALALMTVITQLLLWDKLLSSVLYVYFFLEDSM